jgi:hypothetical protein
VRIRTAIVTAALLPATLAFAVAGSDGGPAAEESCRTDDSRTVTVEAEDGTASEVPVEYCEAVAFAQCDNAVDADAAGKLILPTDGIELGPTAPAGSFQAGEGCGTVDEPVFGSTTHGASPYQYYLSGLLTDVGNVDTVTFEAHFLGPNLGYAGEEIDLEMRMTVDGVSLFGTEELLNVQGEPFQAPRRREVRAVPTVSSTGASSSFLVTVTGLADFLSSFADEAGQGTAFRQVAVDLNFPHLQEPCVTTPTNGTDRCPPFGPSPMVMGATEVPTGVTFNTSGEVGVQTPAGELDDSA